MSLSRCLLLSGGSWRWRCLPRHVGVCWLLSEHAFSRSSARWMWEISDSSSQRSNSNPRLSVSQLIFSKCPFLLNFKLTHCAALPNNHTFPVRALLDLQISRRSATDAPDAPMLTGRWADSHHLWGHVFLTPLLLRNATLLILIPHPHAYFTLMNCKHISPHGAH